MATGVVLYGGVVQGFARPPRRRLTQQVPQRLVVDLHKRSLQAELPPHAPQARCRLEDLGDCTGDDAALRRTARRPVHRVRLAAAGLAVRKNARVVAGEAAGDHGAAGLCMRVAVLAAQLMAASGAAMFTRPAGSRARGRRTLEHLRLRRRAFQNAVERKEAVLCVRHEADLVVFEHRECTRLAARALGLAEGPHAHKDLYVLYLVRFRCAPVPCLWPVHLLLSLKTLAPRERKITARTV